MDYESFKNSLVKRCLEQVSEKRDAMIARLRHRSCNNPEISSSGFKLDEDEEIELKDSLNAILKVETAVCCRKINLFAEFSEENRDNSTSSGIRTDADETEEYEELTCEDTDSLLRLMERHLFEDRGQREEEALQEMAERFMAEEESDIAAQVALNDGLNDTEHPLVMCPLCQLRYLAAHKTVIICTCGFRMDTKGDGLSMKHLRVNLDNAIDVHSRGCDACPRFSIHNGLGQDILYIICDRCDTLDVVI